MPITGISIDIKSLSKAFYTARKSIRLGVDKALKDSGKAVLNKAKANAPVLRNKLKPSLKFEVSYKDGLTSLSITAKDTKVRDYFMVREDGPEGGMISGKPDLVWVPKFSPFYSKTATIQSAKAAARAQGYKYFFQPEGEHVLLGIRKRTNSGKRLRGGVGAQFAIVAIITPNVYQTGKPYIQPAFDEELPNVQQRVITELTRIFSGNN